MTIENEKKEDRNLELIQDYKENTSITTICGKYQISSARVYQILDYYGIDRRRTHQKSQRNKQIYSAFKTGHSIIEIAKQHQISEVRVYQVLHQLGVLVKVRK